MPEVTSDRRQAWPVDGHVHFHELERVTVVLDAAAENFRAFARDAESVSGGLLLAQAAGEREYRARHILVETEDEAQAVIAQLKKGGKFDELAKKSSKDPGSKERGGDLDWNVPQTFDRQFSDAMVKLEKGKYTESPVRTRFGYHVIQLDDVRAMPFPQLADVKPRIQQQVMQMKVDELVRGLRAKAKVE